MDEGSVDLEKMRLADIADGVRQIIEIAMQIDYRDLELALRLALDDPATTEQEIEGLTAFHRFRYELERERLFETMPRIDREPTEILQLISNLRTRAGRMSNDLTEDDVATIRTIKKIIDIAAKVEHGRVENLVTKMRPLPVSEGGEEAARKLIMLFYVFYYGIKGYSK